MDPQGPLPPSVYWRRRVAAAVAAALAMVATVWALGSLIGSEEPASGVPRNAANDEVLTAQGPSSSEPAPISSSPGQESSLLPLPSESAVSSVPRMPGESTGPGASSAPVRPEHGKPLQRCAKRALDVDARTAKRHFAVGERSHLQLSVTNVGDRDCFASLRRDERELVVRGGDGARVWSSADCYFGKPSTEIHRLRTGESIAFDLHWAGRTSAPGCPVARDAVPAGAYTVAARVGDRVSAPTKFTIHK